MDTMPYTDNPDAAVSTERLLSAPPAEVFAAFAQAELLAVWWGPAGFTNTFELFDFAPGGKWIFTMHAPGGAAFPNESIFREVEPDSRIVLEHVVKPWYRLTLSLTPGDGGTLLTWYQEFETPEMAAKMHALCTTANEQVLDRLEAVLAGKAVPG